MLTTNYTHILLELKDSLVTNVVTAEKSTFVYVQQKHKSHSCPACGKQTDRVHDYRQQTVKDMPLLGKTLYLVLRKRRYCCRFCRKRFPEQNHFLARYQRMTSRLQRYILSLFAATRSITSIAQECDCSVSTAIRLFTIVRYPKPQLPKVIGIDEFRGNAGGHKFQCILSDPLERKVIDILPSRNAEDLYAYFTSFPMQERLAVDYVVMDLSSLFASVVRRCFPHAQIVADKFHVCRLANWAMETVRKEQQRLFGRQRRIYFKRSRWLLLSRRQKLTPEDKQQLATMLLLSEPLRQAYVLKEEFYEMLNSTDARQMTQRWKVWQDHVVEANLPSFQRLLDTTAKWSKAILQTALTGYSNGFIEGCNNRTKVLKRVCYGVRNFSRFRNRILYIANSR